MNCNGLSMLRHILSLISQVYAVRIIFFPRAPSNKKCISAYFVLSTTTTWMSVNNSFVRSVGRSLLFFLFIKMAFNLNCNSVVIIMCSVCIDQRMRTMRRKCSYLSIGWMWQDRVLCSVRGGDNVEKARMAQKCESRGGQSNAQHSTAKKWWRKILFAWNFLLTHNRWCLLFIIMVFELVVWRLSFYRLVWIINYACASKQANKHGRQRASERASECEWEGGRMGTGEKRKVLLP